MAAQKNLKRACFPAAIKGISHPIPPGIVSISGLINHFCQIVQPPSGLASLGGGLIPQWSHFCCVLAACGVDKWLVCCTFQAIYAKKKNTITVGRRLSFRRSWFRVDRLVRWPRHSDTATSGSPGFPRPTCEEKKKKKQNVPMLLQKHPELKESSSPEGAGCSFLFPSYRGRPPSSSAYKAELWILWKKQQEQLKSKVCWPSCRGPARRSVRQSKIFLNFAPPPPRLLSAVCPTDLLHIVSVLHMQSKNT